MRIVILTSSRRGTASYCLPVLLGQPGVDIVRVIYCEGVKTRSSRFYFRKLKKMWTIGLLGALNGIRIRKWFHVDSVDGREIEDIEEVCRRGDIPFFVTQAINTKETMELMASADADLGLSLGNSFIAPKVFNIPRYGMLNIHGEVLPDFQNGQSVIWQIYEGNAETGYTIHKVEKKIDGGEIWKQEKFPILIKPTLQQTVSSTCAEILKRSALGLRDLLVHFEEHRQRAYVQGKGKVYTTPSFRSFLRMRRNFKLLKKRYVRDLRYNQ